MHWKKNLEQPLNNFFTQNRSLLKHRTLLFHLLTNIKLSKTIMGKIRFLALLLLLSNIGQSQNSNIETSRQTAPVRATDKIGTSISNNPKAVQYYNVGLTALRMKNNAKAIDNFLKALKEDPNFAYAWDNLGVAYRISEKYDDAIAAYEKSLEINPNGDTALMNVAVVYQYKQEFNKAVEAYEKLAMITKDNPEVYYGIGQIYARNLGQLEKGLDNVCKAYTLYLKQKSPYKADAQQVIEYISEEMKKQGKSEKFNQIIKANNITLK